MTSENSKHSILVEIQNCNITEKFSFPYFANRLLLLFKKKFYRHKGSHWVGENVQKLIYGDSDHHLVKLLKITES